MKQKILFNTLAIVITLALIGSIFMSFLYWSFFQNASAPGCNELSNSAIVCDPSRYTTSLIIWTVVAVALAVIAVVFTRIQLKKMKQHNK